MSTVNPIAVASTAVLTPAAQKKPRATVPWRQTGVEAIAVQIVYHLRIWDVRVRDSLKLMDKYKEGTGMFIKTLEQHGVVLQKKPVWATISNRVVAVLKRHKVFREKE